MSNEDVTTDVGAIVVVLAGIAVGLRFYSRYFTKAGFKWDDWLILVALVATVLTDVLVLYATSVNPDGAEVASNEDPNYQYTPADVMFTKLSYIGTVLYFTITSATKISILLMYNRLFSVDPSFRRQVIIVAAAVAGFWIGCTVADLLNCIPLEWTWNNALDDPRYCFNYNIFWLASGIVEACLDVVIIIMPIRVVIGLRLNKSKKFAVVGVFLLGVFVILSGLVKVILSYMPGSRDPSFGRTEVWTTVHCCTGIVCACLPICWPLFTRAMKLSPSSWPGISSIRKHWYSFSGWSSVERRSVQRNSTPQLDENTDNSMEGYELPMYVPDTGGVAISFEGGHEQQPIYYYEHSPPSHIPEPYIPEPTYWIHEGTGHR
ncbi:hypothetical protein F4814DRAFT_413130 [Daldinia grandis]|nr:hypothetical protein F4814DRAFT_413130 [Daldinia grandis]